MRAGFLIAAAAAAIFLAMPARGNAGVHLTAPGMHVYPVPQSMRVLPGQVAIPRRLTIVTSADADPAALAITRSALSAAGATSILVAARPAATGLNVYLRGRPLGLRAGGYLLEARQRGGRNQIVLAGQDGDGEFYAAETLRELLAGRRSVPRVRIRDWPALSMRGVVEGFYGAPWTTAQRLSMIDFLGAHKLNEYMYAPKDDPLHRALWRVPYPASVGVDLDRLVARAAANHVTFTFAVSPGLSICYSSLSDGGALLTKLQWAWDHGVRSFAVAFDDIPLRASSCLNDATQFGSDAAALGREQATVLNRVQQAFIDTHPGAAPLITVPTEYKGIDSTPYKQAFAATLDRRVIVEWTGRYGISVSINAFDAAAAKAIFPQPLAIWDNAFVNDYCPGFLALGALDRHDAGLSASVMGLLDDPQVQEESSKIGLFTVADYAWNPVAYNPATSWSASLHEFAGGDPVAEAALRTFADANYGSLLNTEQAPALAATIDRFWGDWHAGDLGAASRLSAAMRNVRDAPAVLRTRLRATHPGFLTEAAPWLDATQAWGQTAITAIDLLVSRHNNTTGRIARDQAAIAKQRAVAEAPTAFGTPVQVGPGVINSFIDRTQSADP